MLKKMSLIVAVIAQAMTFSVSAVELSQYPKLQAIADQLIAEKRYSQTELEAVFAKADVQQSVLDAMQNPAEYKLTWGKYRKIFMKPDRIQQGVEFWQEHQETLDKAEKEYGVPASIIVSIIGVETKFGRIKGKHKVLDSLVTLTVGYPRRSKFFGRELKEFLILTKDNALAPEVILGSYAGAVGYPQFISSSYRNYAIDFSGDGKADLIDNPVDAIGSVANYFIKNGWKPGQPVTSEAFNSVKPEIAELVNRKRKVRYTAESLRAKGAPLNSSIADEEKLNVVMLNASEVVSDSTESDLYVVRAGDTACQIADKKKVSCKNLFALNKLNKKGDIYRGQILKLPASAKRQAVSKNVAKKTVLTPTKDSKWEVAKPVQNSAETKSQEVVVDSSVKERFFFTHHNFYAITEYNHSVLYAMAVYELSNAIRQAKEQADSTLTASN